MRGVVAVACALLVSLGSSGCFVSEDDPETQGEGTGDGLGSSSGTGTGKTSGTRTSGPSAGGNATNHAPMVNLTASSLAGASPLNVTFNVTVSDLDGDNVTWRLDFGNGTDAQNGTTANATVTHAFSAAGNHTVTLSASDGAANATTNLTIVVTGGAFVSNPQPSITFTGTVGMPESSASHPFELLPGNSKMTVTLTWGAANGIGDLDLSLQDAGGSDVDASESFNTPVGTPFTSATESIVVDDAGVLAATGTWGITVVFFAGVPTATSYKAVLTFE